MAIGGRGISVDLNQAAIDAFCRGDAGVVADLTGKAERVTQQAKVLAPVSPHGSNGRPSGYLRSQVQWELGSDGDGLFADISTPAESVDGAPYGLFQEVGTSKMPAQPHIRPALDVIAQG